MGLIKKAVGMLTPRGGRHRGRRQSQAREAKAQAGLAEAEIKVAEEQAAVIARALHEDEAHGKADLEEVAEKEAEALPWNRSAGS